MSTIASMNVRIGAHTGELQRGMRQAEGIVSRSVTRISRMALTLGKVFAGVAIVGGGAGMLALGRRAVGLAANFEQLQLAFTTLTGSADKAAKHLRELDNVAADMPFSIQVFRQASQLMHGLGFETERVIPTLRSVADAVAAVGGGSQEIESVVQALMFMRSQGRASSREMLMIARKGIPIWEMLADKLNTDVAGAQDRVTKGMVDAKTAMEAFLEGTESRYAGLASRLSDETLLGAWGTLKANIELTLTTIGDKIMETFNFKDVVNRVLAFTKEFREILESAGLQAALAKALGADLARELMIAFTLFKEAGIPAITAVVKAVAKGIAWVMPRVVMFQTYIAEFLETLPARGKIAFHWLTMHMHRFTNRALIGIRDILIALDSPILKRIFRHEFDSTIKGLNMAIAEQAHLFMETRKKMGAAQDELNDIIEKQVERRVRVSERPEVEIEDVAHAAESAVHSVIEITRVGGAAIADTLKGGFENVNQNLETVRAGWRELRRDMETPIKTRIDVETSSGWSLSNEGGQLALTAS